MTTLDWNSDRVILAAQTAINLEAIALQIEGATKANIVSNGQVDTGFMLNSTYTSTPGQAGGRISAPDEATAVVAVGAEYAIQQELRRSFLFKALNDVAGNIGGTITEL